MVDVLGSLYKLAAIDSDCKQVKVDSKWNAFAFYTPHGSTNLPGWHSLLFSFMASFTSNKWQPIFAMVKSCAKMAFLLAGQTVEPTLPPICQPTMYSLKLQSITRKQAKDRRLQSLTASAAVAIKRFGRQYRLFFDEEECEEVNGGPWPKPFNNRPIFIRIKAEGRQFGDESEVEWSLDGETGWTAKKDFAPGSNNHNEIYELVRDLRAADEAKGIIWVDKVKAKEMKRTGGKGKRKASTSAASASAATSSAASSGTKPKSFDPSVSWTAANVALLHSSTTTLPPSGTTTSCPPSDTTTSTAGPSAAPSTSQAEKYFTKKTKETSMNGNCCPEGVASFSYFEDDEGIESDR